jgi:molybdopterin molybdotransferase
MLSIAEAQQRILATVVAADTERVELDEALDRVVAEAVHAPVAQPPWDNSAMDGYAVRAADTAGARRDAPVRLPLAGMVAAGAVHEGEVPPGHAVGIATGAPMPAGADAVVVVEDTDGARHGEVALYEAATPGKHVRRQGEAVEQGAVVARRGDSVSPGRVALLAAVGVGAVTVSVRPRVAILGTGDEVVAPGLPLGPGQIYSSNTVALAALVRRAGGVPVDHGTVGDDPSALRSRLAAVLADEPTVVLTTGGVSVGPYDFVREVFDDLGVSLDFWKVRMKPGKPLAFGRAGEVPLFGLPGNPVSCMVNFLQFVRPWIRAHLGDPHPHLPVVDATAGEGFSDRPGRARLLRVALRPSPEGWVAERTGLQSSGAVVSMALAHGLLLLGPEEEAPTAGDRVRVQLIEPQGLGRADAGHPW